MRTDHYDVLIIGAGPAGSATAIRFREQNKDISVGLVDKSTFPRDKACGDGLGPGIIRHLKDLDINIFECSHANQISTAEIHGPKNLAFRTSLSMMDFHIANGMTIKRLDFDDMVRQKALACGVEYIGETRFRSFHNYDGRNHVTIDDLKSGKHKEITCDLLVGADGASSRVRKSVGIKANPPRRTGIAIRAYAQIPSDYSDRIILSFEDLIRPGYGWCFPFANGTANVGVGMVISDFKKFKPDLKELLDTYLETLGRRGILVTNPMMYNTHILPHGGRLPPLIKNRVALVGDAASMINPLSGEGIVYGFCAAKILASNTASALNCGLDLEKGLSIYEREFRNEYASHFRSNYIAHRLLRSRTWARIVFGGASIDAKIRANAIDLMFGNGTITIQSLIRVLKSGGTYIWKS